MKSKHLETALVVFFYLILKGLRALFLIRRIGPPVHNLFYYALFQLFPTEVESEKLTQVLRKSLTFSEVPIVGWQRRIYTSAPNTVRHALMNIFARRLVVGALKRRRLAKEGHTVPTVVLISVSTPDVGCNLACSHCYAAGHDSAVLPDHLFRKVLREQEDLGIYNVRLLGGEPFLYKGIWEIFEAFPNTTFQVPTNGTALTEANVRRLAELGNVYPMISLEGFEEETDAMRGKGTFRKVHNAMLNCKRFRMPFGVVITVTKQNRLVVTSKEFLQFINDLECTTFAYSCYVPMGRSPHPEW